MPFVRTPRDKIGAADPDMNLRTFGRYVSMLAKQLRSNHCPIIAYMMFGLASGGYFLRIVECWFVHDGRQNPLGRYERVGITRAVDVSGFWQSCPVQRRDVLQTKVTRFEVAWQIHTFLRQDACRLRGGVS